jgi:hypothetical protein
VLGLLVATATSGELSVAGDRTGALARLPSVRGRLWFDGGRLAGADVGGEHDLVRALVALLWLVEGTFTFEPGQPRGEGASAELAEVLGEALAAHGEWRELEQVLPSQQAWVELNPEPPPRRVTLTPDEWRLVVAVGAGGSVAAVVDRLGADDLPGCRAVKQFVDAGLVTVHPSPPDEHEGPAVAAGPVEGTRAH